MHGTEILAVVDPTASEQPALGRAAVLAEAFGASLELFVCDYDQYLEGGRLFESEGLAKARRSRLEHDRERLEALRAPLLEKGLAVGTDVRWDHPLDRGIVRKVIEAAPLLVAKDTHHHAVLRRTLLSNTDWNLIRSCPAPLLLSKPRPIARVPTVLAAVDPTHEHDKPAALDRAILALAKELATALHGRLHVVHAFDTAPAIAAAAAAPEPDVALPTLEIAQAVEQRHREALDRLLADYPVPAAQVHFEEGPADDVLLRTCGALEADFVVMGAVARGALKRVFIGSTAERVLDRLPCDLVVVKPVDFEASAGA